MPEKSNNTKLERIAILLQRHGVQFIVIDGQAEYIFGSPRVSFDVDLCYQRTKETQNILQQPLKS